MNLEQSVLVFLLNVHKPTILPDEYKTVDWAKVLTEATKQSVLLLAFDAAAKFKDYIPDDVFDDWASMVFRSFTSNARVDFAQNQMISILDKAQVPYIIIKGTSAASYYPKSELRALGDVDFLIDPTMRDEVECLLTKNGYKRFMEDHSCHTVFRKPGAHLEMHHKIAGIPNGRIGDEINEFMQRALPTCTVKKYGDSEFKAPSDCVHGLIILLHLQHHMLAEGIGLRHLYDWGCFVDKADADAVANELVPFLRRIGMLTFAAVLTSTCHIYFGTKCPDWASGQDPLLCEALLSDILAGGNFGRKEPNRAGSGMMISDHNSYGTKHSKLYYALHTVHRIMIAKHPVVSKHPWLYPIFYVAEVLRYVFLSLCGKRCSLFSLTSLANKRRSIYNELYIFETKA